MEKRIETLKNLDSFKFDFMLNNYVTLCDRCNLCEQVSEKKKNEPWFKIFCYQLVRNLETAESINQNNYMDIRNSRCKSLIYWMYDKVKNYYEKPIIKNNENTIKELLEVWKKFNGSDANNPSSSKCKVPNILEFTNIEDMKRKKIMSDYCENYSKLKKILNFDDHPNCHIYYDYFKDSLSKYKEIVSVCNEGDFFVNNCSSFCKDEDPDKVLNESKCRTIEILPKKNVYITQDACDTLKEEALSEVRCEPDEIKISEFTFSDNRAIILILLSLWGVFLTFLFLYKMAPFRSWISNKLGKRKIIRDRFNEQTDDESLYEDYESTDRNMENAEYNVSYNSDWKSSS
ncbi:PIR Superfamily Protein [Plasmodium ovale wallikeri]|uniref:PIR Superfamily Protein n=1 Tax=Plasmodium ovale wallikeri TaxID=864142 RepID=A0A1A9AR20_PLAOA|nr:PIR Superfamily Protein [Plasmodium ovale wallikeri]SBT58658.1 PIR Superfamily Protein [Plasmodium ovale wallikeri]